MCHCFQKLAIELRESMKKLFENVEFMSASTDIWSRCNKSFIAVTVHYYDVYKLTSKFIACEFFPGRHTHDRVAEKLNGIFTRFGISEKVFFVTTDGAGEYRAAFTKFGDNYRSICIEDPFSFEGQDQQSSSSNSNSNKRAVNMNEYHEKCDDSCSDSEDEHYCKNDSCECAAADVGVTDNLFQIEELPNLLGKMNRIDCSAHKLDELGSKDAMKANENDPDYSDLYTRVFNKINEIWKQKESRLQSEIFARITVRKLVGPHRIRWCKLCEAVCVHI